MQETNCKSPITKQFILFDENKYSKKELEKVNQGYVLDRLTYHINDDRRTDRPKKCNKCYKRRKIIEQYPLHNGKSFTDITISRRCSECDESLIFMETIPIPISNLELEPRKERWKNYKNLLKKEETFISNQTFMLNPCPLQRYPVICIDCTDTKRSYVPLLGGNSIRECLDCGKQFDASHL